MLLLDYISPTSCSTKPYENDPVSTSYPVSPEPIYVPKTGSVAPSYSKQSRPASPVKHSNYPASPLLVSPGLAVPSCQRPSPRPRLSLSNPPRRGSQSANCSPSCSNSSNTSNRSLSKWGQQREEEKKRQQCDDCQGCQECRGDSQSQKDSVESQKRIDSAKSQSRRCSVESKCSNKDKPIHSYCNKSTGEIASQNCKICKGLEEFVCSKCACHYRDPSNKQCYTFERSQCIVCRSQRNSESMESLACSLKVDSQCQRVQSQRVQCPSPDVPCQSLQSQSLKCASEGSASDKRLEESIVGEGNVCQCGNTDVLLSCVKNQTNWQCDCACLGCKAKWQYTGDDCTSKVTCKGQCPSQSHCSELSPVTYYQKSTKRPRAQGSQHSSCCSKCGDDLKIAETVSSCNQRSTSKGVQADSSHITPGCPCSCENTLVCTCMKVGNSWQCETTCMDCQAKWETQGRGKHCCRTRMKNCSNSRRDSPICIECSRTKSPCEDLPIAEFPWPPCEEPKFKCPKRPPGELSCENVSYCPYAKSCETEVPCDATTQHSFECDLEKATTCDAATDYERNLCCVKQKECQTTSLTDYEVKVMAVNACNSIPRAHLTMPRPTYSRMPSLGSFDPCSTRYSGFTSLDSPFGSDCDARPRCFDDASPIKPYPALCNRSQLSRDCDDHQRCYDDSPPIKPYSTLCNRSKSHDAHMTRRNKRKETYNLNLRRKYC